MSANMLKNMNDLCTSLIQRLKRLLLCFGGGASWGTVSCQVITDLAMKVQSTFKGIVTCTILVHIHTYTFPITLITIYSIIILMIMATQARCGSNYILLYFPFHFHYYYIFTRSHRPGVPLSTSYYYHYYSFIGSSQGHTGRCQRHPTTTLFYYHFPY